MVGIGWQIWEHKCNTFEKALQLFFFKSLKTVVAALNNHIKNVDALINEFLKALYFQVHMKTCVAGERFGLFEEMLHPHSMHFQSPSSIS